MKSTGCTQPDIAEVECMALRDRIKNMEFEAEHLQQDTLHGLVSATPANSLETAAKLGANASNLRRYLNYRGIALDPGSRTELAHIVTAAIHSAGADAVTAILDTTLQEA